jgi:YHS domain-containing protein
MKLSYLLDAATVALAPAIVLPPAAMAEAPIYTGLFDSIAVQGYDPVAYFTDGKPVKGSKEFSTEYQGATFVFASAANRDKFVKSPAAYAPQYGGYCAWAVSQGYTAKGDAQNWKVVDGKLYLNYNTSIQKKWEADVPGFIKTADTNWPEVLK